VRILIAPDAFKGSLTATQAAESMAAGILDAISDAEIELLPLADGGEGTLDVLFPYVSHENNVVTIECYIDYVGIDGLGTALIESARCLGLTLPAMQALDVFRRGSGALGECIRQGLDAGIRLFVIGLGGSATNDAGLGLLATLGLRAMDDQGRSVSPDLQGLLQMDALDVSGMDARLADCRFTVLCDVDAPLSGATGATFTFGPQKGLSPGQLPVADRAMARFATMAEAAFGVVARDMPGSGAAGGLGFALALLGGELVSGAEYVIGMARLAHRLDGADWVITGEGRSDAQTLAGKLPLKVAMLARAAGVPVALISGDVADGAMLAGYFDAIIPACPADMPVQKAMAHAGELLREVTAAWAVTTLGPRISGLDRGAD
jgi:glycerate 2-kinase